ncbi:MAG: sulfurtransferase [Gemmatimonadales bacterium]
MLAAASTPIVLDARPSWIDYLQGHLPEAQWTNIETFRGTLQGVPFQLFDGGQYRELFRRLGIGPEGPVVITSAGESNDMTATYLAWLLAGFGRGDVSVLDGGYAKWVLDAGTISRTYAHPPARPPIDRPFRPDSVTLPVVLAAVRGSGALLVDARSAEQFAGSAGAQRRRGHIPGAVSHPWPSDLETRDLALVWKPTPALRESYAIQGITPDRDIIVYCNTDGEASHVWFALRAILGYPRVRIYVGSWSEWAERDDVPVE